MTKTTERTKVVVRRLPPYLREEDFKAEVDKAASGTYTWFRFCQGKTSTKRVTYSRGYLNFRETKEAVEFKSKFEGFVFVGARGTQYKCSIEFAPYQRVPKKKHKTDHREGTIDEDPEYIAFVEKLDKEPVMLPSAQRQFEEEQAQKQASGEGDDAIMMTPLMEFVVNKYLKKPGTGRFGGRERREDRRRERRRSPTTHKRGGFGSKSPPKVLLKLRPTPKSADNSDKPDGSDRRQGPSKGRNRRAPKVREGHQAWVPKVMKTGMTTLNASGEEKRHSSAPAPDVPATSFSEKAGESRGAKVENLPSGGRGRGRRHRGGKNNAGNKSASSKVVWVPKNEKQGGE